MRTIKPLTLSEVLSLTSEPYGFFGGHTLPIRIIQRLTVDEVTGCWLVSGWNSHNGFANMSVGGRTVKVHRVIYTLCRGPIPAGHVLDHKKTAGCRHRNCGNPDHLEPVTVKVNTERGAAVLFRR